MRKLRWKFRLVEPHALSRPRVLVFLAESQRLIVEPLGEE
jgi:hypothetical protein